MNTKSLLALAFLLSVAGSAQAWDWEHKWYVGVDVGQSTLDNASFAGADVVDDHSTAYTLKIGYRFIPWLALEGGYTDIGDFSATYSYACPAIPGVTCADLHETTSIHGVLLNVVGIWPVAEHFQLNASLGAIYRELSASSGFAPANRTSWTDKDTVVRYGFGLAVPINEHFEIGLDYVLYRDIGLALNMDSEATLVDEGESKVASLGIRWRF